MTLIDISADFQHQGRSYTKGERVYVTSDEAAYFCGVGWASNDKFRSSAVPSGDVTLTVQDIIIDTKGTSL